MSAIAVFGYGSLISPRSVAETLGREPDALIPARLEGWKRRWSLLRDNFRSEKTFARESDGEVPPFVIGLNLERGGTGDEHLAPNGALIGLTSGELERLDVRELRYNRVAVTEEVAARHSFDVVFAYTARAQHFTPQPPEGAVAMAPYLRAIEAAFRELGDDQWQLFLETTGLPPVTVIEPVLVRDEIPPGNPREW
jgi:cation transport regulator ChaC